MRKVVIVVIVISPHTVVLNLTNSWSKRPFYTDLGTFRNLMLFFDKGSTKKTGLLGNRFLVLFEAESTLVLILMLFLCLGTDILNLIIN